MSGELGPSEVPGVACQPRVEAPCWMEGDPAAADGRSSRIRPANGVGHRVLASLAEEVAPPGVTYQALSPVHEIFAAASVAALVPPSRDPAFLQAAWGASIGRQAAVALYSQQEQPQGPLEEVAVVGAALCRAPGSRNPVEVLVEALILVTWLRKQAAEEAHEAE